MPQTKKYILSLDQGTTSCRSILFDQKSQIADVAQKEFQQIYPSAGWVEHDPEEIWSKQSNTINDLFKDNKVNSDAIQAIGITNQRETTVVWNRKTGEPIYNAIVWQDRRTADYCEKLKSDGIEKFIKEKTGLLLDPYFSGTKLRWILDNVKGAREKAESGLLCFGTIDTWLLRKLTNGKVHATDLTNASRTLLCNIKTGEWDPELLKIFNIPVGVLPEIKTSSEVYGTAYEPKSLRGIPIAGIAGDQQAALFGQACFEPGMVKNTYGTGCFTLMNTGNKPVYSKNNLLTTVASKIGDKIEYALEGSVFIGGAIVQWMRDELKLVNSAKELDTLAISVEDTEGVYIVPAFAGLGAPYWDPYARGTITGLTRGANRAHLCRAALESIAFQSADLIESMEKDSGIKLSELRVDGGATNSKILMQIQSNLLQVKVVRPKCIETTALGAAYLAGLATNFWQDKESILSHWEPELTFDPLGSRESYDALRDGWKKAIKQTLT
jgi:glycerol kinase